MLSKCEWDAGSKMTSDSPRGTFPLQAVVLVGQYSIWVKWAPPLERNQLITIAVAGTGTRTGSAVRCARGLWDTHGGQDPSPRRPALLLGSTALRPLSGS